MQRIVHLFLTLHPYTSFALHFTPYVYYFPYITVPSSSFFYHILFRRNVVMQADPDLTRTVLVTTKLDTKLPQFSEGDDLEDFLRYVRTYALYFSLHCALHSSPPSSLLSSLFSALSLLSSPLLFLLSASLHDLHIATPLFILKLVFFLSPSIHPYLLLLISSFYFPLISIYLSILLLYFSQSPFDKEVVPPYDGRTFLHICTIRQSGSQQGKNTPHAVNERL